MISCDNPPPNIKVCGKKIIGAACSYTIKGKRSTMSEEKTQLMLNKLGTIFMSAESYGEIKSYIEQECIKVKGCTGDLRNDLQAIQKEKKNH